MPATLLDVLQHDHAGKFVFTGDPNDYGALDWQGPGPKPTEAALQARLEAVGAFLDTRQLRTDAEEALGKLDPAPLLLTVQMATTAISVLFNALDEETKARVVADPRWAAVVAAGQKVAGG